MNYRKYNKKLTARKLWAFSIEKIYSFNDL